MVNKLFLILIFIGSISNAFADTNSFVNKALTSDKRFYDISYVNIEGGTAFVTSGIWTIAFGGDGRPNFEELCSIAQKEEVALNYVVSLYVEVPKKHKEIHLEKVHSSIARWKGDPDYIRRISLFSCNKNIKK